MTRFFKQFVFGAIIVSIATTAGYLIAPIEVRYLQSLTSNSTLIGATYAIGAIFFALLSVWLGRISDRVGRNKFLIMGCAAGIIYPLLYASTYNIYQYMGVKLAWAFSGVTTGPIFMAYLQDMLTHLKKKGHYMGIVFAAQSALGAGASFAGGYLSDKFGLVSPYYAMALLFVLATVVALRQITFKSHKVEKQEPKRSYLFGLKYIFGKPALIFYFIVNTAFSLNWKIKTLLWPLIIYGMTQSNTMTGSVFATMGLVAFAMLLFIGKLVDKIGPFLSAHISMLLLGGAGLVLALTGNPSTFWFFAAVFAIGEALNGPTQAVLLTEHVESKYRGEILGLDAVFDNVFGTLSPFLAGLLLAIWPAQKVLLVYIAIFWIALAICITFYNTSLRKK